jgi:hypothetical protein
MPHLVTMGMLLLIGFCATGCRPTNLLDEKVDGRTPFGFVMWRAQLAEKQTPQERQELAETIQEVNYWVTTNGIATGSVAVDEAVRAEIDGVTVRELLLKGYEAKRQRLDLEKVRLEDDVATNSQLQTRPGDTDSADYLARVRQEQTDRLDKTIRDLRVINKRLDELGGSPRLRSDRQKTESMDMQPQLLTTTGH